MTALAIKKRVSPRTTSLAAAALLVLWGASYGLSFVSLGGWSLAIALAIAAAKVAIVVLVFMEIVVESASVRIAFALGAAMVAAMIALMVADVATRAAPPDIVAVPSRGEGPGR